MPGKGVDIAPRPRYKWSHHKFRGGSLMKNHILCAAHFAMIFLLASALRAADVRVVDAARAKDRAAVQALISQKADVNAAQPDGATALHWAAHWDDAPL